LSLLVCVFCFTPKEWSKPYPHFKERANSSVPGPQVWRCGTQALHPSAPQTVWFLLRQHQKSKANRSTELHKTIGATTPKQHLLHTPVFFCFSLRQAMIKTKAINCFCLLATNLFVHVMQFISTKLVMD